MFILFDYVQMIVVVRDVVGVKGSVSDQFMVVSGGVVQVDVKVVEFDKIVLCQIGLSFKVGNNGFSYSFGGFGFWFSGNGVGNDVIFLVFNFVFGYISVNGRYLWNVNFDLLQSDGLVWVLVEFILVVFFGQSVSFFFGGEFLIFVFQGLGIIMIVYKFFGIGFIVILMVFVLNCIVLKVVLEVSDFDYINVVLFNGVLVFVIIMCCVDIMVELGDGEIFIVGGLVSQLINL